MAEIDKVEGVQEVDKDTLMIGYVMSHVHVQMSVHNLHIIDGVSYWKTPSILEMARLVEQGFKAGRKRYGI